MACRPPRRTSSGHGERHQCSVEPSTAIKILSMKVFSRKTMEPVWAGRAARSGTIRPLCCNLTCSPKTRGSHARRGRLTLNHGPVETPSSCLWAPMAPSGCHATKASPARHGRADHLGNTFHLWMRPGLDVMRSFGGLHGFEQWHKPILTDSGGFQVWSLGPCANYRRRDLRLWSTATSCSCRPK